MKFEYDTLFEKELKRINIEILTGRYVYLDNSWNYEKMRAPFTRIYMVDRGEGFITYGDTVVNMRPGNIYIIPPEFNVHLRCDNTMDKLFFHINLLGYDNHDLLANIKKCIVLENRREVINTAIEDWRRCDMKGLISIKSILYNIVNDAINLENALSETIAEYSTVVKRALHIINDRLSASLTVSSIAHELYISVTKLENDFKREIGVTVGQYINERLLFKAENLLRTTPYSIKEIGERLGYCDQFYFSRCFTKYYHCSPLKYRKNIMKSIKEG